MRKHRIEIRVWCALQKVKHWREGIEGEDIESEDIEGERIESDGIGGKYIAGEGKGD